MAVPRLAIPRLVIRNGIQARRHMREIERDLRERISRMETPERRLLRREFEGPIERISERVRLNRMNAEALSWMDRDYLGRDLHRTFSSMPPFLSEESARTFERLDLVSGGHGDDQVIGRYFEGTNHIIMEESVLFSKRADTMLLVAHEQLHYASWLGGGGSWLRWTAESGEASDHCPWLHEGLTELHAQQLVRGHGYAPSGTSYPPETAVSYYIQRIAGGDVLRAAYLSGDFSEVRRRLNSRLGENTFEVLVGKATIPATSSLAHMGPHILNGMEAVRFIRERMDEAGIDRSPWRSDPVLGAALDYLNLS